MYCIFLPLSQIDKSSIELSYDSSNQCFTIENQFVNGLYCFSKSSVSSVSNGVSYVDFFMNNTSVYSSFSTFRLTDFSFPVSSVSLRSSNIENVLASNVDLVYNGTVLHAGSQAELESYFDSSALPKFFSSDSSGTVSTGSGDNSAKQVQISNNILTNIKSII